MRLKQDYQVLLQAFYDENFKPRDKRKQIDSRPIRRMDSLARLLSLSPGESVCSACSLHNGSVVVAANVTKQSFQQQVADALFYLLDIIYCFINEMKNADSYLNIEKAAGNIIDKLLSKNSSTLPRKILLTALAKLTYSVHFDDGAFSKEERAEFLKKKFSIQIILPSFENKQSRYLLYKSGCDDIVNIAMPGKSCCATVRNIHAEQILAKHILSGKGHSYSEEALLKIGISKLCCLDCFVNLQKLPVQTRGCHGLRYEGTFQVFETNQALSFKTPPRKAPTCAVRSDPRSPTRSIIGEGSLFSASSLAKRKLDFREVATPKVVKSTLNK